MLCVVLVVWGGAHASSVHGTLQLERRQGGVDAMATWPVRVPSVMEGAVSWGRRRWRGGGGGPAGL